MWAVRLVGRRAIYRIGWFVHRAVWDDGRVVVAVAEVDVVVVVCLSNVYS